ncbi:transposase [Deinococcus altitudinis]|uniref:transposase n=1 Tax=Deinococcus altitudinis TaxID=468914 RepID=UPI00389248D2
MLLGILQAESTLHRKIALHLPRIASLESKTRVLARVFHDEQLKPQDVLDILLPLLPVGRLTMVMDRTNWHYGQTPLNLLVLGVALGGVVIPLVWTVLPHQGNSCSSARILPVAQLLKLLPAKRWAVLIADREFVGREWCDYLRWRGIKRCFRIKENTRIDDELARDQFENLQPGEVRSVFEKAWVYGSLMQVVVTLSPVGERVIVASDLSVLDTLQTYQKHWGIECSFSVMKSRGLGLEATHMTAPDRLSRLFGLLCIALAWMVRVGDAQQHLVPPPDNRGRLAKSKARTGWMLLSQAVRWGLDAFWTYFELLKTSFPALDARKSRSVSC